MEEPPRTQKGKTDPSEHQNDPCTRATGRNGEHENPEKSMFNIFPEIAKA